MFTRVWGGARNKQAIQGGGLQEVFSDRCKLDGWALNRVVKLLAQVLPSEWIKVLTAARENEQEKMQAGEENKLKRIRQIQIADLFYSEANLFSQKRVDSPTERGILNG